MKTIHTNVYEYGELSPQAQEKARDWFREGNEYESYMQIEDAKQCLLYLGFEIKEIYFSGFSCQGDGACFSGTWKSFNVDFSQPAAVTAAADGSKLSLQTKT